MKCNRIFFKVISFLSCFCLCACNDNSSWFYQDYYTSSLGQGSSKYKIFAYQNGSSIFTKPFNTDTLMRLYQHDTRFDSKNKDFLNDNYQYLHALFDNNYDYTFDGVSINNLKTINDNYGNGKFITIDQDLYDIMKFGVEMTTLSNGRFNIAIGSISSLWDEYITIGQSKEGFLFEFPDNERFDSALSAVPNEEEIEKIVEFNDHLGVRINKLDHAQENVKLTLGAIGKGYATKKLNQMFSSKIGYISSGESSVSMLSESPFNKWKLVLSNPIYREFNKAGSIDYKDYNQFELRLEKNGRFAFSTSGYYERFYYDQESKQIYHHIIDGTTGMPMKEFDCVSALCNDSLIADAVTTALMGMSIDEGKEFIHKLESRFQTIIYPIWYQKNGNNVDVLADEYFKDSLFIDSKCSQKIITNLNFITINH